ncbi:HNH endonuclease signature motif containing protein [Thermosynechococcaceae cyanobacterium BACA0444]|uniref:HNH endonuclease signature motif containing protein n=1 Tax=Pseudocalidococcus azoricus BACA0444 TaxID=2918990 RepID=A0AAE4FU35_9CYAN|nr:HNH endonuclease signature motif containing protein [Pseudocalidococcus azoricus]MDS3862399.1 HNH endonuclease signature motif containing protein [Pseudocalidococcus azoricus BACA0444]
MAISKEIRHRVRERAKYLCEYCHSSEEASAARFEVDHIQPRSRGGADTLDNLALACQRCNSHRYNFTEGVDPESQVSTQLFNPRLHQWNEHFVWEKTGLVIRGKTSTGRATCNRLDLNDQEHNDGAIVKARSFWIRGGWHPPSDDVIES